LPDNLIGVAIVLIGCGMRFGAAHATSSGAVSGGMGFAGTRQPSSAACRIFFPCSPT
jgi:hypothetical protein